MRKGNGEDKTSKIDEEMTLFPVTVLIFVQKMWKLKNLKCVWYPYLEGVKPQERQT